MIRDPSDGSVREPLPPASGSNPGSAPRKGAMTTGLPPLDKDQNDASRLKRSREQLENYKRTGVWKCQE